MKIKGYCEKWKVNKSVPAKRRYIICWVILEFVNYAVGSCHAFLQKESELVWVSWKFFLNNIMMDDETPLSLYVSYRRKATQMLCSAQSLRKCVILSVLCDLKCVIQIAFADGLTLVLSIYQWREKFAMKAYESR